MPSSTRVAVHSSAPAYSDQPRGRGSNTKTSGHGGSLSTSGSGMADAGYGTSSHGGPCPLSPCEAARGPPAENWTKRCRNSCGSGNLSRNVANHTMVLEPKAVATIGRPLSLLLLLAVVTAILRQRRSPPLNVKRGRHRCKRLSPQSYM